MKIELKNVRRKLFGFLSFTTALFVFQACYGAPQDESNDLLFEGKLLSDTTGLPAPGIKIVVNQNEQYALTDTNGNFSFYVPAASQFAISLIDADTTANGHFLNKDTVMAAIPNGKITITIPEKL